MDFFSDDDDDDRMEDMVSDDGFEDELDDYGMDDTVNDEGGTQKTYKILKEEDIKQLLEDDISAVCNVLSVSRSVACTLLCQNKWNRNSANDKWFESPVVVSSQEQQGNNTICTICYETTISEDNTILLKTMSAACGHPFCVDCWKTYISTSIENKGLGCLTLKCPEPGCESHPGLDMVESLSSLDDKSKYYRYLCRSFVHSSTKLKWCPAPDCDFAIEFDGGGEEGEGCVVMCDCGWKLCWNCGDECHSPLDCKTVSEWTEKNNAEAENTTWILAYTKPCPKCKRSIEKNQGCNHMTCTPPCEYHFCWTCLEDWNVHGYDNACNGYSGKEAAEERKRKKARVYMDRYKHYYRRWDSNDKSRKMALASLRTTRNEHLGKLEDTHGQTSQELNFIVEAWEQIVECRRVLKWSYAYGYYNMSRSAQAKMDFFEHLQGKAEVSLEGLHHCAEKEIETYLKADGPCDDFNEFRKKLVGLTLVTKNYFENLVTGLENNLSEVEIVGGVDVDVDVEVEVEVDRKDEIRDDEEEDYSSHDDMY